MSNPDATQRLAEPFEPNGRIERLLYILLRFSGWNLNTVIQVVFVGICLSVLVGAGLILFVGGLGVVTGAVHVEVTWGRAGRVDLTDSQYERVGEEVAEQLRRDGFKVSR